MSSLVHYEPLVESTTEVFLDQTDRLYATKEAVCDFSQWLQFYAFDVIGDITYSKRHGFIERAEDIDGIIAYLAWLFSYVAPIGQIPVLDLLFLKNPLLSLLDTWGIKSSTFPVAKFARDRISERLSRKPAKIEMVEAGSGCADLLSKFLRAQRDHPDIMTDGRVLTMATSMAFAGSETTAISLSAVFYYLLKHPTCYRKLLEEVDAAVEAGSIQDRPSRTVSWAESQKLLYLDACIKEAFRLHPAVGLPLERIVPAQGARISGEHIPGGTIVGCSAWVIHRRKEIFGDDVDLYRPERWFPSSDESPAKEKERIKEMNSTMFHFGMGARTCIGKNISLLEIYKLVPSFLRRFEVQLVNPEMDWKLHNAWFVQPLDFRTTFRRRHIPARV
ncbi:MAG: hypothetical protein M1812_004528 [Candelaria pacifica]|nr:MAG: hypothetical protein M1812_004528 [Candelaria pacifica]